MSSFAPPGLVKRGPRPPSQTLPKAEIISAKVVGPRPPSGNFDENVVESMEISQLLKLRRKKKGKRASDLLRGIDSASTTEVEELMFAQDYKAIEEEKPHGIKEKIVHIYKKKINEKKAIPRLLVCALAVSLLWASSLAVCRAIVETFVPSPSYAEVEESVLDLNFTTVDQGIKYKSCVDSQFKNCRLSYESTRNKEVDRVFKLQKENENSLLVYKSIQESCASTHDALVETLNVLRIDGANNKTLVMPDYVFTLTESVFDCQTVDAVTQQQFVSKKAVEIALGVADASNSAIDNLTQQVADRVAYDLDYMSRALPLLLLQGSQGVNENMMNGSQFKEHLTGSLDELESCLTDGNFEGTRCPNNTLLMEELNKTYNKYESEYEALKADAERYKAKYEEMYKEAKDIYTKVENAANSLGLGVNSPLGDISLNSPPFNFGAIDFSEFDTSFFDDDFLKSLGIDPEEIERRKQEMKDELYNQLDEKAGDLDELYADVREKQKELEDGILTDYNPPPVDIDGTTADHRENAAQLANQISNDLNYVSNTTVNVPDLESVVDTANQSAANLLTSVKDRQWDTFGYPAYVFEAFKIGLADFADYAVAFDSVWRALQSIMLIKKYWGMSGILTPPADVKSDQGYLYTEKKSVFQLLAKILTHPMVQLINIAVWLAAVTAVIYFGYSPVFSEYVNGCVDHTFKEIPTLDDGTMIYRNLETTVYNLALTEGDKAVTTNIDALNLERQISCQEYFRASVENRFNQNNTYELYRQNHLKLVERYLMFDECVDWEKIDVDFNTNANFGFSLKDIVDQPRCKIPFGSLDDTVSSVPGILLSDEMLHNCSSINSCPNNCPAVPRAIIQGASFNTACTVEWALHSYFLTFLFATVIYICVNISRFYLMRGIVAVWWKRISVDVYSYMGSTTINGTIVPPKRVRDGESFPLVIKEELQKSLKKFARNGYFELAYAVVLNIPWVVFLAIISQKLKFNPA